MTFARGRKLQSAGFKRPQLERKPVVHAPVPEHLRRRASYGAAELVALPKSEPQRNRRLLDLAKGAKCQMAVPGVCCHDPATVVAAHSNSSAHGKAGARKADDNFVVYACHACHVWYDQGAGARDREAGQKAWDAAHARQIAWWRQLAADPRAREPDRQAAAWALERVTTWASFV